MYLLSLPEFLCLSRQFSGILLHVQDLLLVQKTST